jgi:hypothetical protein
MLTYPHPDADAATAQQGALTNLVVTAAILDYPSRDVLQVRLSTTSTPRYRAGVPGDPSKGILRPLPSMIVTRVLAQCACELSRQGHHRVSGTWPGHVGVPCA